jgi:hypothetical protein
VNNAADILQLPLRPPAFYLPDCLMERTEIWVILFTFALSARWRASPFGNSSCGGAIAAFPSNAYGLPPNKSLDASGTSGLVIDDSPLS